MTINNSDNFNNPKTIIEIKMQLGCWRDELSQLENRIDSAKVSDVDLSLEMDNLEALWNGLKLTKEDLDGRLELAKINHEASVEKEIIEMQDTIAKVTTVFKRTSSLCSSRALNLVQESYYNALSLSDSNQIEALLLTLNSSLKIVKLNPFYAHEQKRIDELLGLIDSELKQINGIREQKAKRIELLSSLCERFISIKTLDELKKILPPDLHIELKQILFPKHCPSIASFDHLDLFDNTYSLEQISDALKELLQNETTVAEDPKLSNLMGSNLPSPQNCSIDVPANSLLILPTEVLFKIFQLINNRRDYRCLSLACRTLRGISCMKGARNHALANPTIPEFIHRDSYSATSMNREAKMLLSKEIEKNMKMKERFDYKELAVFPTYLSNIPYALISDYLVYQTGEDPFSSDYVFVLKNLKTSSKNEIKIRDCLATAIVPVHGALTPLFVTAIRGGFKIWDFEALKNNADSKNALLLEVGTEQYPTSWIYAPPYKDLMIHSFNNFIIVGDANLADCLYFIDCSQEFKKENVLKVNVKKFQQIVINEDQAFVVNSNEITVWNVEKIKACIVNKHIDPKDAAQTWTFNEKIENVKVFENEVVVSYCQSKKESSGKMTTLGVLLNRTDGTLIRKLSCKETSKSVAAEHMQSMDISDHKLISAYDNQMTFWDMDTKQDVLLQSVNFNGSLDVRKISAIGRHILLVLPNEVMLFNQDDSMKVVVSWNSNMRKEKGIGAEIESCDLFGRYLVTVCKMKSFKVLHTYDLLQDCDALKK